MTETYSIDMKIIKRAIDTALCPAKSPNEMLRHIFVATRDGMIVFISTDGVRSFRYATPFNGLISPCLVSFNDFKPIAKSGVNDIKVKQDTSTLYVNSGRTKYKLPTLDPDEFPWPEKILGDEEVVATLPRKEFIEVLKTVKSFAPKEDSKDENVKAVDVCNWKGMGAVYSTSRASMCLRTFTEDEIPEFQIPVSIAPVIAKMTGETIEVLRKPTQFGNEVGDSFHGNLFFFRSGSEVATAARAAYAFPDWRRMFEPMFSMVQESDVIEVSRDELLESLNEMIAVESNMNPGIHIDVKKNKVTITSRGKDGFSVESTLDVKTSASEVFGVSPSFLKRCVEATYSDTVHLHVLKKMNVVFVKNNDGSEDFATVAMMRL